MLTFVPYSPEDLRKVDLQPAQASWRERFMDLGYARSLDVPGRAWTGLDDAGRVAGCAGFAPQWEGRVIAWAVFGKVPRPAWSRVVTRWTNRAKCVTVFTIHHFIHSLTNTTSCT